VSPPRPTSPTVAVDLRALVPEATGIGIYTRSLLTALARRPRPLRYLGMAHARPRGTAEVEAAGIEVEVQPAPLGVWWQQWALPRRLRRGDVDLLFSPLQTLPLSCPVPAVVTVHDLTVLLRPEDHRFKVRWSQLPFLARSLARARRVIAVSHATADDLLFQFPDCRGKLRVIHHGVDPASRPAAAEPVARLREELGAPRGYLLFVGPLEPRKNLAPLLTAWESRAADAPDFPPLLLAGGEGWHSRRLRRRIAALRPRGLRHLGRVDAGRLVELFQAATAFAYPSLYEGFGLPVLEAMACGVPCVTSDLSSLPEVAGRAALTVDPRNAAALAAALRRLVADRALAAELAGRGVERAAGFTWQRAAAETEETLRDALDDGRSATDLAVD